MFSFLKSKSSNSSPVKSPEPVKPVAPPPIPVSPPIRKSVSHDQYIQLFNSDGDTVFINLATGFVYWKLPDRITFQDVKYFSHINDEDGKLYYEEASNGKVAWSLPEQDHDISSICRTMVYQIDTMSRSETEELIGITFNEDITNYINEQVDQYLANLENTRNINTAQTVEETRGKEDSEEDDEESKEVEETQADNTSSFQTIPTKIIDLDYYIQTFNNDGDPLFVGLCSGKAYWILPSNSLFEKLKLFSHINEEDGQLYFEEIDSGNTTWELAIDNEIVYQAGYDTIYKIDSMNRGECEIFVGQRYNEEKIQQQNESLDNYLEEREEKKKISATVSTSMKQPPQPQQEMKRSSSVIVKGNEEKKQQQQQQPVAPSKPIPVEETKAPPLPPQPQEKKPHFIEKTPVYHNNEYYIQTFNGDGDTIIVGLTSAIPYWSLPKNDSFHKIRIFSHVNENDGKLYFEDSESGEVTWSLTTDRSIISKDTSEMVTKIDNLSRKESEILIGSQYNDEVTLNQNDKIDEYLTEKDRLRQEEAKEKERRKKQLEEEAALKKKKEEEMIRKNKQEQEEENRRRASMKRKEIEQEEIQKKKEKEEEQLRLRRQDEENRRRASVKRKEDERLKMEHALEEEIRNSNVKYNQERDNTNEYEEDEDSSSKSSLPLPLPSSPPPPPPPPSSSHITATPSHIPVPLPPSTASLKLKSTKELYMQSFNVEGDTVLIGLLSGKLYWKLPLDSEMNDIIYLTHLKEDGRILYEDLSDGSFLWSPPSVKEGIFSSEGHRQIVLVEPMTRDETEHSIGIPYKEEVTNRFNDELEKHLEHLDEIKKKQGTNSNNGRMMNDHDEEDEEEGNNRKKRSSSFTGFNGNSENALAAMQNNFENQEMFSESLLESNLQQNQKNKSTTAGFRQSRTASLSSNVFLKGVEEPIIYHDKGNQLKTTVYQVNLVSRHCYFLSPSFLLPFSFLSPLFFFAFFHAFALSLLFLYSLY
jgi:hypothetical protein